MLHLPIHTVLDFQSTASVRDKLYSEMVLYSKLLLEYMFSLILNVTFNSICYLPFLCEIYKQFLGEDCKTKPYTVFSPSVLI